MSASFTELLLGAGFDRAQVTTLLRGTTLGDLAGPEAWAAGGQNSRGQRVPPREPDKNWSVIQEPSSTFKHSVLGTLRRMYLSLEILLQSKLICT